jgi:hypothetical protein
VLEARFCAQGHECHRFQANQTSNAALCAETNQFAPIRRRRTLPVVALKQVQRIVGVGRQAESVGIGIRKADTPLKSSQSESGVRTSRSSTSSQCGQRPTKPGPGP